MSGASRLGVGIIGAGRVGPVIGAALAGAGHALVGITAGSDRDRVEAMLPGVPVLDADEIVRRSELVVIAVPHDELPSLVAGLAELDRWQVGQLVLHTDPAWAPTCSRGAPRRDPARRAPGGHLHRHSMDLRQLHDAFAAVTAPAAVLPIAQALAVELGCEPVVVAEADRAAYGEAIATATEFSASVVRQATSLLRSAGIEEPGRYLSTLVHSAVDRALQDGSPRIDDVLGG
jgi:predicted short-subunit dehydrogenase-like oxidoreductase (DUF2520 family)